MLPALESKAQTTLSRIFYSPIIFMPVSACAFYRIIEILDAFSFQKYVCGSVCLDLCGYKNYAYWNR